MRRPLALLVVVLAACSGATEATTTTAAPAASSTVESQSLIPGGLIPVDPATLVPYEDAEPIVVAAFHDGVVSPNGQWAGIHSEGEEGIEGRISIVELDDLAVVASDQGSGDGLSVDDGGQAVWFDNGLLRGLRAGEEWPSLFTSEPVPAALSDTLTILGDGRIAYLRGPDDSPGTVDLVLIEDMTPTEIELEGVVAGPVPSGDGTLPSREYIAPAVAWDEGNDRALVVSATENTVVEVDLTSGEATTHGFEATHDPGQQGVGREVFVNRSGTVLLIASRILESEGDSESWTAREYAGDLVIVDTANWSSQTVDPSIWALDASPDGTHIAGTGASVTWDSAGGEERLQSPVYLIDGTTGQPLVGFEGRSGTIVDAQFSGDGAELYVVSESPEGTNIDIVDVAAQGLAGSLGFQRISLIGEAGLLAFHLAD